MSIKGFLADNKRILLFITYGVLLAAGLFYFKELWSGLSRIAHVLIPFLWGLALAFIANVFMRFLEQKFLDPWAAKRGAKAKKFKRPLALLITLVFIAGLVYLFLAVVVPEFVTGAMSLAKEFPQYAEEFSAMVQNLLDKYNLKEVIWEDLAAVGQDILNAVAGFARTSIPALYGFTLGLTSGVVNFFLGFIIAVYMLSGKERLCRQAADLVRAYLPAKVSRRLIEVANITNETFRNFVGGQLIEAVILGVLTYIGMRIFQMPHALVISVIIGCTNIIPVLGPIIGVIPCALLLLVMNPMTALIFVIFIIVLQQLESNLIYPRVVGKSIGLPAIWVLFGVLVGGGLFGLIGVIIGVPTCAVLGKILSEAVSNRLKRVKETTE